LFSLFYCFNEYFYISKYNKNQALLVQVKFKSLIYISLEFAAVLCIFPKREKQAGFGKNVMRLRLQ